MFSASSWRLTRLDSNMYTVLYYRQSHADIVLYSIFPFVATFSQPSARYRLTRRLWKLYTTRKCKTWQTMQDKRMTDVKLTYLTMTDKITTSYDHYR